MCQESVPTAVVAIIGIHKDAARSAGEDGVAPRKLAVPGNRELESTFFTGVNHPDINLERGRVCSVAKRHPRSCDVIIIAHVSTHGGSLLPARDAH